ncbi:pyruvate:ferredoxin (flavodoxin) oxidoreductase [Spirochaetia bacterium]|nr:pyruvate:ferredoxin (flavodoxin) oxidoreductase [Spirochaetia bacterium]
MILNCLITGVGGQGTVLMSRLIGGAAIKAGLEVRGAETIGMAQRGGSVVSHLRLGDGGIYSPLIAPAEADIIIAFESAEAVRVLPFLAPSGSMIVLNRGIPPVTSALSDKKYDPAEMIAYLKNTVVVPGRLTVLDSGELIRRCGNSRVLNVALLGAALAKGLFPFNADHIAALIKERLAPQFVEMNLKALETGLGSLYHALGAPGPVGAVMVKVSPTGSST